MSTREIRSGDTLSAIAAELGITLDELLTANPQFAANPDLIYPGQNVVIPGGENEEPDSTATDDAVPTEAPDPLANMGDVPPVGAPTATGNTVIPSGGRLIGVNAPSGSDDPMEYYITYDMYGVTVAYRVGGQARMDELFPAGGLATFDSYQYMQSQSQFDQAGFIVTGEVDEVMGMTESPQSVFERDLRAQGLESLPSWIMNDPEAMSILVIAANEGWSEGRTWKSLQATDGFSGRFPGLSAYMGRNQLADVRSAVSQYVNEEQALRGVLRAKRGANTNVDTEYLGSLISSGWTPQEANQVLDGEAQLKRNPEALQQFQQLMALQGQEVGVEDFLDVFRGRAAPEVTEILNDTFRFQALAEQGLDIDATFAQFLGQGSSSQLTPNGFTEDAQRAAQSILRFGMEIDAGKMGITREQIIAAAFDQESQDGTSAAEVNEAIARFGRDRATRARGLAGFQAFINQQNRLQVAGVGDN